MPPSFPEFDALPTPASAEAGRAWNDAARARKGNPEKEKAHDRWSKWVGTAYEQELREHQKEESRDKGIITDAQVEAWLRKCRREHAGHWAAKPHGSREKLLF